MDISPLRHVNQAIDLRTTGALETTFKNIKTNVECLAEELISAAKGSSNRLNFILSIHSLIFWIINIFYAYFWSWPCVFSYAINKKDQIERVAKANR